MVKRAESRGSTARLAIAIAPSPVLASMLDDAGRLITEGGHTVIRPVNRDEWRTACKQMDVVILTPRSEFDEDLIAAAPNLRAVLFPTIGVDPIDVDNATRRGVAVGHSAPPAAIESMAQATVALIAMLSLRMMEKTAPIHAGGWREGVVLGRSLAGKTVGLIGFGRIGRAVADLLKPWGARIIFHDPIGPDEWDGARKITLPELLRESDVVSLHAPRQGGRPLIGDPELALMKNDALLINTARGGLVDEAALADALNAGRLAGAAIDAFDVEPLPVGSPLRSARNIILTPHNAGHTEELMTGLEQAFQANLRNVLDGRMPVQLANPDVAQSWHRRFS